MKMQLCIYVTQLSTVMLLMGYVYYNAYSNPTMNILLFIIPMMILMIFMVIIISKMIDLWN